MNAIPTKYSGVQFRSRLEAKWAAFFDLLGWEWEYEPLDLAGYIPDFLVRRVRGDQFLVEVKPFTDWPCPVPGCLCCPPSHGQHANDLELRSMMDEAIRKIQQSGWKRHAVVVGATLVPGRNLGVPRFGMPVDATDCGAWFDTETVVTRCRRCPTYLAQPDVEGWGVGHDCDGSDRISVPVDPTPLWREAGNRVQWHSPLAKQWESKL